MSVTAYPQTVSAIDPNTGQLVELSIDQSGAYMMQDGSAVLTTSQLQGGKSLLKPELAQHLNQHVGYKTTVGRGGFTVGANDPRWMNVNSARPNRSITRKPLGTSGSLALSQPVSATPATSGLLSLGARYTPASAGVFNIGTSSLPGSGTLVTSSGSAGGHVSAGVGVGVERDPNYRLAQAISGTGGRGRPRGRRPLRGQFPVVPIDMVRQLGIEQQVILQPAAPVAMRNKAVLCRPLSMCRKTQASVVRYESTLENNMSVQTEDELYRRLQHRKETMAQQIDASLNTEGSAFIEDAPMRRKTLDAGTSTVPVAASNESDSQTDAQSEDDTSKRVQYIPIPIPVPIFVPTPVCIYACPVPYTLPFPLPCFIPLPVPGHSLPTEDTLKSDNTALTTLEAVDVDAELSAALVQPSSSSMQIESPSSAISDGTPHHAEEDSDSLVIASEPATQNDKTRILSHDRERGLKRPASPIESEAPTKNSVADTTQAINDYTSDSRPAVTETKTSPFHHQRTPSQVIAPPAKRPRHTMVVSDANYHLKFSYGINAWRHWVQQRLSALEGISPVTAQHQYPHLRTELLSMSESDLNTALSQFVREVRKPNNEGYVADSIFYLCLGIQEYLNENGCEVNLFGGPVFSDFSSALDEILANFQPRVSPEGLLICRIEEEHLWEARQLGTQSPEVLLFTVLYFNTKHFGLRLGTSHRQLAFAHFQFVDEHTSHEAILCHLPSAIFGDDDPSSTTLRLDTNENYPDRCPVQLFRSYFSLCPPSVRVSDDMFYVTPVYPRDQSGYWYSSTPVEPTELQVILNRIKMVKEIQEAFMNGQPDGGF